PHHAARLVAGRLAERILDRGSRHGLARPRTAAARSHPGPRRLRSDRGHDVVGHPPAARGRARRPPAARRRSADRPGLSEPMLPPAGRAAVTALAALHVVVALAGFVSPNHYAEQHRGLALSPPMKLHWIDAQGRFTLRPFVHPWAADKAPTYHEDRSRSRTLRLWVEGSDYRILGVVGARHHLLGLDDGEPLFLLGTDSLG